MSIINFGDQFANEYAYWYPKNKNFALFHRLAVQNMNESRKSYNNIAENIYGNTNAITLRTRFRYGYAPPENGEIQHIKYREKWYEIAAVRKVELGNLGLYRNAEYYLELIEVAYGPNNASTN